MPKATRSRAFGGSTSRKAVSKCVAASLVVAALALGACRPEETAKGAPGTATPSATLTTLRAERNDMAAAFATQAAMCTQRQDTGHPVFHGCVDWHSAAHGAWALVTYQSLTGDKRYAAQVDALMNREALAAELADLKGNPGFEMPYGRAWFLRLATSWRAGGGDDRLDALATLSARDMRAFYESMPPDPNRDRYDNPAWALINLLAYARAQNDAALEAFVVSLVRVHFTTPNARCDRTQEENGFIAVCTVWAWLAAEALPGDEFRAWYARWNPGLENAAPVRTFPSAHDYGRNFSRAWGLPRLADATGDARLLDVYAAHVAAGYDPPSRWRGSYMVNGHWVAQFGMLAISPLYTPN
jgi:hypothetical protein